MRLSLIAASLVTFTVIAGGCNAKPTAVRDVDQSVLPAQAKSLLVADAEITRVEEELYKGGSRKYVIHYTQNGESHKIKYLDKHESKPHYVFEDAEK